MKLPAWTILLVLASPLGSGGSLVPGAWLLFDLTQSDATSAGATMVSPDGGAIVSYHAYTAERALTIFSCTITEMELAASAVIEGESTGLSAGHFIGGGGVGCTLALHPEYEYLYVIFAGEITSWTYEIDAPLLASGPEVLYREARDFEDGTGASTAFVAGSATIGLDRNEQFQVQRSMLGYFGPSAPMQAYDMRIDGPTSRECPCNIDEGEFGPGDYTFTWTGAGLDFPGQAGVLVLADVAPRP